MKTILVPIDFSEYSMNALEMACYIAKVKDMKVRLLHVIEDSYVPYFNMLGVGTVEDATLAKYRNELNDSISLQLSQLTDNIKQKKIEAEFNLIFERAYRGIINEAEEHGELIIMGSYGANEIEDILIGSTTEKVIRRSPIPVLTVHNFPENYSIDKIVFASDFEEPEIESILQRVIDFAEIFMAEIYLVRINTPSKFLSTSVNRERLNTFAAKFNLSAGSLTTYSDRSEEEGIVNYAREVGANLIALCTHGRTGISRFFKGSIAEDVAGFSNIPVLTYNLAQDKISRSVQPITKERKTRPTGKIKPGI